MKILTSYLKELDEELKKYSNAYIYQYIYLYLKRATIRFIIGAPMEQVFEDFWNASKSFHENSRLHFYKTSIHEFRKRRLDPLETTIIGGDTSLISRVSNIFGFSINPLLVGLAEPGVKQEASKLTSYFDNKKCNNLKDIAGLGAISYGGALSSMLAGFDDEAQGAIYIFLEEIERMNVLSMPDLPLVVKKYITLNQLLNAILHKKTGTLGKLFAELEKLSNQTLLSLSVTKENIVNVLDRSILSMLGLVLLKGIDSEITKESQYYVFLNYMKNDKADDIKQRKFAWSLIFDKLSEEL